MYYFAYGSNMHPKVMAGMRGKHKVIGPARLYDHRLAFTRLLPNSNTGVADVIASSGHIVWGVLYDVSTKCRASLDRKEGNGESYKRVQVSVALIGDVDYEAFTYVVIEKSHREIPPSTAYLDTMIEGARLHELPQRYVRFLKSLYKEGLEDFRTGFLVIPTTTRSEAHGMNLVRVSKSLKSNLRASRLCAVIYRDRICLTRLAYDAQIPPGVCEVDQSIRRVLDIGGSRFAYGAKVQLRSLKKRVRPLLGFLTPRTVVLPLYRPYILDSEKQICVLHRRNMSILGLNEGDYISIKVTIKDDTGNITARSISRRVFAETPITIIRGDRKVSYPQKDEFYLDLDGRLELGINRDAIGVPVLLSPDLWQLFSSRMLYYGIVLFVGLLALVEPLMAIWAAYGWFSVWGAIIGVLLSVFLTSLLTVYDLRSRVQY